MGYKPFTDSTLKAMTKKEIIECVRVAEHNFFAYKEANENQHKYLHELNAENAELKRLLRLAVDDLMGFMNDLCESTEENSCYSPCAMCLNQFNCEDGEYLGVKWLHLDEAKKLIGEGDNK